MCTILSIEDIVRNKAHKSPCSYDAYVLVDETESEQEMKMIILASDIFILSHSCFL